VGGDPPSTRPRTAKYPRNARLLFGIVAAAFVLIVYGSLADQLHANPVQLLFAVAIGAPLALLPDRPLLAWRVLWLVALVSRPFHLDIGDQPWPWHPLQLIGLVIVLVAVALRHPLPVLIWVWAFTAGLIAACCAPNAAPGLTVAATVALVLGDQIRRRGEAQRGLRVQEQLSEQEQERRAVLEERQRIAREMHDVVAHHMSLIAVRAETAPYRLGGATTADTEFAAIAQEARASLTEMRRLLGVLRSDGNGPALAPQPGLAQLPALVESARAAGVPVELRQEGEVPDGAEAAGLTAYRIAQEALANAGRHAPGAPVLVVLQGTARELHLVIRSGPAALTTPPPTTGVAHGLTGMYERVAAIGGELTAGPTPDGGFLVEARLPL